MRKNIFLQKKFCNTFPAPSYIRVKIKIQKNFLNRKEVFKMTNKMILKGEMLNEEQLDMVNGGTVAELNELVSAFADNNKILGALEGVREFLSNVKAGSLTNIPMAYAMENFLKKDFGIDSNISVGWLGTGTRESGNTYREISTGKGLSHADVVQRVKSYGERYFG